MNNANRQPIAKKVFNQQRSKIHVLNRRKEFVVERTETVYGGDKGRTPGSAYGVIKTLHYCNGILNCNNHLLRDAIIMDGKRRIKVIDRYKGSRNEYSVIVSYKK